MATLRLNDLIHLRELIRSSELHEGRRHRPNLHHHRRRDDRRDEGIATARSHEEYEQEPYQSIIVLSDLSADALRLGLFTRTLSESKRREEPNCSSSLFLLTTRKLSESNDE